MTEIMLEHAPKDWPVKRLGQLFRERKEKVNDRDFPPLSVTKLGILPQLESAAKSDDSDNRKGVRAGDFVINSRSDRKGSGGLSELDGSVSLINIVLEPRDLIYPRFAHHLLRSPAFQEEFYRWGHGIVADLWTTRYTEMKNILLAIPDRETQKAVADFLDFEIARIDQLIEKRSRFASLVLERRDAIISKTVVGTEAVDGGWLTNLSDDWRAERAKFHFRESQDRSNTGEEELLTVSHITGVTKRSDKDVNMFLAETNEGYKLVAPNDLIINTMWAWMGAMGVSWEHGLISPSYGVYRPISDQLRPEFVDMMVRAKPFVAEATRRSKGIHSSRLRLYPDAFLDMLLPIPPIAVQDDLLSKIAERAEKEDDLLRKNTQAEKLLREFRAALITAAVTGQIDVTAWGKQGQTDRRLDHIEEEMAVREARA